MVMSDVFDLWGIYTVRLRDFTALWVPSDRPLNWLRAPGLKSVLNMYS